MNRLFGFGLIIVLLTAACRPDAPTDPFRPIKLEYPEAYTDTMVKDDYHGLTVGDPFRWLEDSNDPMTRRWIREQQSLADQYFAAMPFRAAIKERLEELWDYERFSSPVKKGKFYYLFKNDGLQDQNVLYRIEDPYDADFNQVLDPNALSEDGSVALTDYAISRDGSLLACQLSRSGSDWQTIRVMDLESGQFLPDSLRWVKFSKLAWFDDGFFYSRYAAPPPGQELSASSEFQMVYYHRVGTSQEEDQLAFADRVHPYRIFNATTTDDERYLLLQAYRSDGGSALYFRDLQDDDPGFAEIEGAPESEFVPVGNLGRRLLVLTSDGAPNRRLILIDTRRPEKENWRELLPESSDVLASAQRIGDKIIATYIHDAAHQLRVFSTSGWLEKEVELPSAGTVSDLKGGAGSEFAFFTFTSFTQPETVYELDLRDLSTSLYRAPRTAFHPDGYETRQVWYESYDGTRIPMYIIHRKGLAIDGQRPTLLYGYGGFNVSILPRYNVTGLNLFQVFLENGGVCAVANLRGGGEFGERWRQAGTKENKQKGFDDFQSAAEYLIANRYTSSDKLAVYGRSNGGLLVGACLVQRPELYAVALPAVGVLDMLRYHRFTIGRAWAGDFGTSENPEAFKYLYAYSPLHTVTPDNYPATLITTADRDDRVVPAHSYKFAATLQAAQQHFDPVLIRIARDAGHGAGKPTTQKIEEAADLLAFTFYNLRETVRYQEKRKK